MSDPHTNDDLRIPGEKGWEEGDLESHINARHGRRLIDLMVMSHDDLQRLHDNLHEDGSFTLQWGEVPPWMEQVGTREGIARNGIAVRRFGDWIGEEPVFVMRWPA